MDSRDLEAWVAGNADQGFKIARVRQRYNASA